MFQQKRENLTPQNFVPIQSAYSIPIIAQNTYPHTEHCQWTVLYREFSIITLMYVLVYSADSNQSTYMYVLMPRWG